MSKVAQAVFGQDHGWQFDLMQQIKFDRLLRMEAKVEYRSQFVGAYEATSYRAQFRLGFGTLPTKSQYRLRLTELMVDAADDETPLKMSAAVDFLRHLKESALMDDVPRGMMGATPDGDITVAWRRSGKRLSVTFVGDEKAMVVRLSPGERAKARLVDRNTVEGIVSEDCEWIASKQLITSSHT